jgi:hypothetical protein
MAKTIQLKPKSDVYVGILLVSLLALIGACALLFMEYSEYDSSTKPPASPTFEVSVPKTGR